MKKSITELRLARGLSQTDLASKTGIPRSQLSKIESKSRGVEGPWLDAICKVLECSPDALDIRAPKPRGGQTRPAAELLTLFRALPERLPRPEWTSAVRIAKLRYELPGFMRRFNGKLAEWWPFLDWVGSDCNNETIFQLLELDGGAGITEASLDYVGFDRWPVVDDQGRAAGHLLRPALVTKDYILFFQVNVLTPTRYRMDGLLIVLEPQRVPINLEIDGRLRDPFRDAERAKAIGLYTIRIKGSELFNGPTLLERLRQHGFCLPKEPDGGK